MPQTDLHDLKPQFLEVIELIRNHRKGMLGKKGPTPIPISELKNIAAPWKINRYLQTLVQDGVIGDVEEIPVAMFNEENPGEIVLPCLKTIEEIQEYRYSLQGRSNYCVSFPISSWSILEIRFTNDQEVIATVHNDADTVRRMFTYGDMGFADKRSGAPDINWEFFKVLAKHNGVLSPMERELPHRNKVAKWKQGLKNKLQEVFRLDEDPFYDFNDNQQYELKFSISYPDQE